MYLFWEKSSDRTHWFLTKAALTNSPISLTKGIDRTPSFQPHLPPCDRCFVSTMRSFGRFETFSVKDFSDRRQRLGYCS
ncbi:MAG: hypothetical protein KME45_06550 [Stenomitos rutilans HA7619-LM2]|nr:hypothetical protein [Stenomitos rutilans HA7619-LM2]